jgi:hypothetical protein
MMKRNRSGQTGALRTEARTGATLCLDLRHKYDSYINMQRRWTLAASLLRSQANHYLPRIQQEKIEGYDI